MKRFVVLMMVACALLAGGCARKSADTSTPQGVVERVLELRRDRVSDPKAYAPFFADASIPDELAKNSKAATVTPVPGWSRPYVSAESSGSVEVVVVWTREDDNTGAWPEATMFKLTKTKGRWLISDAGPVEGTVPPAK